MCAKNQHGDNKCVALASAATDTHLTFVELKISSNADGRVIGKKKEEVQEKTVGQTRWSHGETVGQTSASLSPPFKKRGCASLRDHLAQASSLQSTSPELHLFAFQSTLTHLLAQAENLHRQLLLLHPPAAATSTSISNPQCRQPPSHRTGRSDYHEKTRFEQARRTTS